MSIKISELRHQVEKNADEMIDDPLAGSNATLGVLKHGGWNSALSANTTGFANTANGLDALRSNTVRR